MVILDTSAAIEMAQGTSLGLGLFTLMLDDEEIISCEFFKLEAANVLRKIARTDKDSRQKALSIYKETISMVDRFIPNDELFTEAMNESFRLGHPIYDMLFFVLARRTGGTLFTTDTRLQNLCLDHEVECVSLMEL